MHSSFVTESHHNTINAPTQEITKSSGNVHADLGFPEPKVELAKAELARAVRRARDFVAAVQERQGT